MHNQAENHLGPIAEVRDAYKGLFAVKEAQGKYIAF